MTNRSTGATSAGPGLLSLILGVLGVVVPFLPIDMTGVRGYPGLIGGAVGLVLGVIGCTGSRPGKGMAITGLVLSALALAVGLIMLGGLYHYSG